MCNCNTKKIIELCEAYGYRTGRAVISPVSINIYMDGLINLQYTSDTSIIINAADADSIAKNRNLLFYGDIFFHNTPNTTSVFYAHVAPPLDKSGLSAAFPYLISKMTSHDGSGNAPSDVKDFFFKGFFTEDVGSASLIATFQGYQINLVGGAG